MLKPAVRIRSCDGAESVGDRLLEGVGRTRLSRPQAFFDLGPALFDGVEVRRVRRQGQQRGLCRL